MAVISWLLTNLQYNDGIPPGSRFATQPVAKQNAQSLQEPEGQEKIRKVRELSKLAKEGGRQSRGTYP